MATKSTDSATLHIDTLKRGRLTVRLIGDTGLYFNAMSLKAKHTLFVGGGKKTAAEKQRVIDEYLSATGSNFFIPGDFIDWLADKPNHPAYDAFYARDDASCAREYRIDLARKWASGLRICVKTEEKAGRVFHVKTSAYPAFMSPMDGRGSGGGYVRFDPNDKEAVSELRRQAALAMQSWLNRYRGVFIELDLTLLDEISSIGEQTIESAA